MSYATQDLGSFNEKAVSDSGDFFTRSNIDLQGEDSVIGLGVVLKAP